MDGQRRHKAKTDADGVIREGWLFRMTPSHMGITKDKFKKRWYMVQRTPVGEVLTYRKAPDDPDSLTKTAPIKLSEVLTVHEGFSESRHSNGMEQCEFQISTEHKTILFRTMTTEERDLWVSLLRPSKQGYMLKSRLTRELKLQTRWFVLKAGKLYYFKSPTETRSCKTPFAVHGLVVQTKAESGSTEAHIDADLDLIIHYGDETYLVRSANRDERDSWMAALRDPAHAKQLSPTTEGASVPPIDGVNIFPEGVTLQGNPLQTGDLTQSPRFLSSVKKGGRFLSKKMGSAADLVGDTVTHTAKGIGDMAGNAAHLAGNAAHLVETGVTQTSKGVGSMMHHGASKVSGVDYDDSSTDEEEGASTVPPQKIFNPMAAMGDKSADSAAANTQTEQGQSGGGAAAVQHADLMHNPATNPGSKKMMNPMIDDDEDSSEEDAVPSSGEAPAPAPGPEALAPAAMASEAPSSSETNGMAQPGTGLSAVSAGSGSIGAASSVAGSMMSTGTAASDEDLSAGQSVRRESKIDMDLLEISKDELELEKTIGRGSFGEVYKCHWRGTTIAVKILTDQAMNDETLQEFRTEVNMMNKVRHPNVVLLMGICSTPPHLSIITEYLARGSMYRLLHHTTVQLEYRRKLKMGIDVSKGMAYLHSATPAIVHRDLKSPNLLVDENFTVKICDFGLARFKENTFVQTINGCAGTPNWMAPEVLRNEHFDEKADVFSMGVILWELIMRREPYKSMQPLQVIAAVVFQGKRLPQPPNTDPRLCSLIDKCWGEDPKSRPSFSTIQDILQGLFAESMQQAQAQQQVRKVTKVVGGGASTTKDR